MTIMKLPVDVDYACADFHDNVVRNIQAQKVQCDEIWAFLHAKSRTLDGGKAKAPPKEARSICEISK